MCLQCDNAACVASCPVRAISRDEERGLVLVDGERCIGCMACVVACPFGNMHAAPAAGAVHKCDLCATCGGTPRCALFCPTRCLTVEA
jgi:carbon-monoxide dehydrogenase iron sulfur subunit